MALTFKQIVRIDLEHEPGAWIEARMPSLTILERARSAKSKAAMELVAGMDLSRFQGYAPATQTERQARDDYDWLCLLQDCITAWSYEEPVTPDNVAELDQVTVDVLLGRLVPQETDDDRKNGSGGSTRRLKAMAKPLENG